MEYLDSLRETKNRSVKRDLQILAEAEALKELANQKAEQTNESNKRNATSNRKLQKLQRKRIWN